MTPKDIQEKFNSMQKSIHLLNKEIKFLKSYNTLPLDNIKALEGNYFHSRNNVYGGTVTIASPGGTAEVLIPDEIRDDALILTSSDGSSPSIGIGMSTVFTTKRALLIQSTIGDTIKFLLINTSNVKTL